MEIKSVNFSGFGDYVRHRVFDELHREYTTRQITKSFTKRTWRNGGLTIGMMIYNRSKMTNQATTFRLN